MLDMSKVDHFKQSWDKRRPIIIIMLIFLAVMLVAQLTTAVILALLAKFGFNISTFFIVFVICNFIALLGIIGSWIFGATWEHKDFLNILPQIIPHMDKDDDPPKE